MTAAEKRELVRSYIISREGKNQYTQGSKRNLVDSGWSDCSSLQQRAYQEIGINIGSYTGAQILRGEWVQLGGELPDESLLLPGDELFFSVNYNNGRPYRVGHIEMYVGNGEISGHGHGIGPVRKNMLEYCRQRNASNRPFIGVKRYIENNEAETGNPATSEPALFIGECTGNQVNIRTGPAANYENIAGWPRLNKGNLVEVLEKVGSWYQIRIAYQYTGYIYDVYIRQYASSEDPSVNPPMNPLNRTPKWVGAVTASILNVRSWAGTEHPKIKSWPQLSQNNLVDVCDSIRAKDGSNWYYIRIDGRIYGFVQDTYIRRI